MQKRQQHFFKFLFLIFCAGIMTSCGGDPWTSAEKDRLIDRCREEGGSKTYCKCYLKNAMEAYPDAEEVEELDFESAVELSIDC